MDITPLVPEGKNIIQSYGPEGFCVNGHMYNNNIVVFPDSVKEWKIENINLIEFDDLKIFLDSINDTDIILIGSGKSSFSRLPQSIIQRFHELGANIDLMDTGAACRTYNVLVAEGRRVVAALIAV